MPDLHSAVIAGTHSGVGKTTWSLALMAFFRRKGLEVQPFKVGPDYIDPGFHHRICRPRKSRNLDRFFLSEAYLRRSFEKNSKGADLALVEGVMGLFDGRSPLSEEGSTAQMAKLLELPVFLVIDGAGLARSAAALVKGYQSFDPRLSLCGILINRVGGEGHFKWLCESIEKETGLPVLGWLPPEPQVSIPERHLGLRTAAEEDSVEKKLSKLAELLEGRFDVPRFLKLTRTNSKPIQGVSPSDFPERLPVKRCRIGVAYDRAFSFYYEDNFDFLREAGAELVFFSPLEDPRLPLDLDAIYLGGGFPELYVRELGENESMKNSIREFWGEGGILYSECGGLIYLAESCVNAEGRPFPLVGLIPGRIRMTERLQHFGYHEIETRIPTFLFGPGRKLRSHEFHYSVWETDSKDFSEPYGVGERGEGFYNGRILASYQHLHFGQSADLARRFVESAEEARRKKHVPSH